MPRLFFTLDEVVEVAVERGDEIADDGAAQHDVLVAPGGVGVVRRGAEVLVADVEPAGHGDGMIGLAVDDPHLLVEALVECIRIRMRRQRRDRHLVQPLQRHGLVAFDLDAVLLQVEEHPLRLQPGIRECIHDDAHVEAGRLLLLQNLGDAQPGLVALEHERLDADGFLRIPERLQPHREGVLAALQDRDLAAVGSVRRKEARQCRRPVTGCRRTSRPHRARRWRWFPATYSTTLCPPSAGGVVAQPVSSASGAASSAPGITPGRPRLRGLGRRRPFT